MNVLVTGGAGYIGSHVCMELLQNNCNVLALDNLQNSSLENLLSVSQLSGKKLTFNASNEEFSFYEFDLKDSSKLRELFSRNTINAIIHCAGYKSPEESQRIPLDYFDNNITASISLFQEALRADISTIIFSSSASVYGIPESVPVDEKSRIGSIVNVYARTKYIIEEILSDMFRAYKNLNIICLRYFNPVGSHSSGLIGENPKNLPNNLMPRINNVALGEQKKLLVYGNDYDTRDGTGIRDYIHIVDLAKGHTKALDYLMKHESTFEFINLGRGVGTSVLEMISAYEETSGVTIPIEYSLRRDGDIEESWADVKKAKNLLKWEAKLSLEDICRDNWRWLCNQNNIDL